MARFGETRPHPCSFLIRISSIRGNFHRGGWLFIRSIFFYETSTVPTKNDEKWQTSGRRFLGTLVYALPHDQTHPGKTGG